MVSGMARLQESEQDVEHHAVNSEKYIRELFQVCWDVFRATVAMFEHQHLRFVNMFFAAGVTATPRASWRTRSSRT